MFDLLTGVGSLSQTWDNYLRHLNRSFYSFILYEIVINSSNNILSFKKTNYILK